jgi:hypothetical protein
VMRCQRRFRRLGLPIETSRPSPCLAAKMRPPHSLCHFADLQELNRRRPRLIQNLRRVYAQGARVSGELAIEFAIAIDALPARDEFAQRFADRVDPGFLRAIGRDDFPGPPIRVVGGPR